MDIINPQPTTILIPLSVESDIIGNPITPTTSIVGETNPTPQLTPIEAVNYQPLTITNQPLIISNQPLVSNNSNINSLTGNTTNININPLFDSGIFTVENTGKVTIDYLFDGGGYKGELAIFSLTGMEQFVNNYTSFIKEAATRSLTNTNLGHIVISDTTEGARISGTLGEKNWNNGDYLGVKTFDMLPGDKFGLMLTPNGTIQQVFDNPKIGGAIRPLFSLSTANPNDGFQLGQIADITGNGNSFVMEDLRIDRNSDKDYNDMIFLVSGATGIAPVLSEVINPNKDWRTTELGESLIDYLDTPIPPENNNEITDTLSDRVRYAIERAEDLANYDPTALKSTQQWVVGVTPGYNSEQLATLFGSEYLGATGHIPNTHIIEFSNKFTPAEVQKRLDLFLGVEFAYPLVPTELVPQFIPNDPLFPNQWNLDSQHINVTPAWDTVTGKGVVIGVVDDGLQYNHPDLQGNYRADLSRDFNETIDSQGNIKLYEKNPRGTYDTNPISTLNGHGTSVAGIAVAEGNNGIGVSGVAPGADLAGLRLIEGKVNDKQIADALSYLRHDIDIYNNSWKPRNSFWASPMAEYELGIGASQGRNGLGNVYVFAAGNDAALGGNVNYNNFANSRQAITVGAVNSSGRSTGYSEAGASVLVSAYANGITTTDLLGNGGLNSGSSSQDYLNQDYTNKASGTSSAAPQVSGTIALMLEANPSLSLRDVQHILVETAVKNNPTSQYWVTNGAGNNVHDEYGFGVVDAAAAVSLAKGWTSVGSEVKISAQESFDNPIVIPDNDETGITRSFTITEDITVESVEVLFDAKHDFRGDLEVILTSPDGTESVLASPNGIKGKDFDSWVFTSVRNWGESAVGEWKLSVKDWQSGDVGSLSEWGLNIYGGKPTVTLKATDDFAAEGEDDGEFTVFRSGNSKNPLTVNYEIDPNYIDTKPPATNGVDYEKLTGTITIPAGADSVKIPIKTLDDTVAEFLETVKLKLKENNGYQVGNSNVDWLLIADTETPEIGVSSESYPGIRYAAWTSNYTSESGNRGGFGFGRLGNLTQPLTVNYSMTGDAINGVDYQTLPGSFTIPGVPKESLKDLRVAGYQMLFTAIDDNELESDETALLTITPSSDYTIRSGLGTIPTLIADNDSKPTVNFTVNDSTASEYGDKATFTLSRTGDTTNPLDVKLWITNRQGNAMAVNGKDFELINETITIPSGESSVVIDINPIDDNIVESSERLDVLLVADPAYSFGVLDGLILSIQDNDKPTVAWRQQLGTSDFDSANSVTNDSDGNIYITGRTTGNFAGTNAGLGDTFIAKYNSGGSLQWKQQLGTVGYDEGTGITVDSTGNIYLTGWTDGGINGNSNSRQSWISKYDNSGNFQWQKSLDSTAYDLSQGKITVDNDGNLYLAGRSYGNLGNTTTGDTDAWFAKYNSEGNEIWSKQLGNSAFDEATGIAVDNDGFVYIAGQTQGNLGGTNQGDADAWLAKYDGNGSQVWVKQLGTAELDKALGVAVDNKGHVYISGQSFAKLGDTYQGSPLDWVGDTGAGWAGALGDLSGLGGTYYGNGDAFVAQFDTNGNLKWKRLLGTTAADISTGVTADKLGNVYLSGYTLGNLSGNNAGSSDIFGAKYDEKGALQWKQQLGSSGKDVVTGMTIGGTGIVMAGYSNGNFEGVNFGGDDGILVKLG